VSRASPLPPSGERSKAVMVIVIVSLLVAKIIVMVFGGPDALPSLNRRTAGTEFDNPAKKTAKMLSFLHERSGHDFT
jgi:hypothetical protein